MQTFKMLLLIVKSDSNEGGHGDWSPLQPPVPLVAGLPRQPYDQLSIIYTLTATR